MESQAAILFDLDGTLSDPREGIVRCINFALAELGYAQRESDDLERYIGPPLHDSFAKLFDSKDGKLLTRAVELYRQRFSSQGMFENTVYPGIEKALGELRTQNLNLYVVTSKPTLFATRIVDHFSLKRFFKQTYGSELDGSRADKRDLIAHVLAEEQCPPNKAIMIGDREHDIKGALANGVFSIGVLWGYGTRDELTQAGAAVLCDTPEALVQTFVTMQVGRAS